jgi:O-antigen/teichoic acid export membrane protein
VNLLGRGIALILTAVLIPLYLHILGVEAVGLIGFYNTMFTAMGVIEYAIGTMIMREIARLSEIDDGKQLQHDLLRTTEAFYVLFTVVSGIALTAAAPVIARIWLSRSTLDEDTLIQCVRLMGWAVTLQLFGSLYTNVLNGLERQLRSNVLAIALALARGFSALFALLVVSATIQAYFASQLVAVAALLVISAFITWRSLPRAIRSAEVRPRLLLLTWYDTRSLTGAAILFVLLSQADKLIASALLPLNEFGYYVVASMIASLLFTIYGSISVALVPRFTRLLTLRADDEVRGLFHAASQFMALMLLPVATVSVFHAGPLVFLWTGDSSIAAHAAPLVVSLTIGTLLVCLACASNSLQLAAGFSDLNLLNNIVWIAGLPIAYFATLRYGALGATILWLIAGVLQLALGPTLLHRRMLGGEQTRWYLMDLGTPAAIAAVIGSLSVALTTASSSRALIAIQLGLVWIVTAAAVLLVSPALRVAALAIARRSLSAFGKSDHTA